MGVIKNDFYFAQFEIFFLCFVIITLIFYTYLTTKVFLNSTYNLLGKKLLKQVFVFGVIILSVLAWNTPMETYYLFFGFYQNNPFTNVIRIFICILFLIFLIGVKLDFDFEFWVLMAISVFSSILIFNAADIMSFFFAIELQNLTLYILVATKQNSALSTEAALKYFTIGSFSSALMLFGISFLYGVTGLTSFNDLKLFMLYYNNLGIYYTLFILGFSLFLVGILFKIGAAPFHIWIPDVYGGSSWSVLAYISILPKFAVFLVTGKFYYLTFLFMSNIYQPIFHVTAISSVLIGSLSAIYQIKLKRLFAYSAITNAAYLVILLATNDFFSVFSFMFYLISYTLIILGIFIIFTNLRNWSTGFHLFRISSLTNLYEINPALALCLLVLIFSLAGIPPFLGFFSKLFVFYALITNNNIFIAITIAILTVVSTYYYLRLVKLMFFNRNSWIFFKPIPYSSALLVSVIIVINVLFILDPTVLINLIKIITYYFLLW